MSEDVAISVQNLTKIYKLYDSPRDRLKESLHPLRKKYHRDFFALHEVSFDIKKGETVAIVGRNGSGKSTLLKTITGVLTPSSGSVTVDGKISALLELGAGFHPQLTGLENIYFNGTIMGYTRGQMDAKLEQILSFADIGEFVKQPVKTYSSGMFMRLAFAVAVNVDPEILIIDEALAVGDARFTKKCYDRFNLFREQGKTILMVTHDTEAVKTYARHAVFLDEGRILYQGEPKEAVKRYLRMLFPVQHKIDHSATSAPTTTATAVEAKRQEHEPFHLEFKDFHKTQEEAPLACFDLIRVAGLQAPNIFHGDEKLQFTLKARWDSARIQELLQQKELPSNIIMGLRIQNQKGTTVLATNSLLHQVFIDPRQHSSCTVKLELEMPRFCKDHYFVTPVLSLGTQEQHTGLITEENLIHLTCVPQRVFYGFIDCAHQMEITQLDDEAPSQKAGAQ